MWFNTKHKTFNGYCNMHRVSLQTQGCAMRPCLLHQKCRKLTTISLSIVLPKILKKEVRWCKNVKGTPSGTTGRRLCQRRRVLRNMTMQYSVNLDDLITIVSAQVNTWTNVLLVNKFNSRYSKRGVALALCCLFGISCSVYNK